MENVAKPAIAMALLAVLGIGCYTWGEHSRLEPASPVPVASVAPASMADTVTSPTRTAPGTVSASGDPTLALPNPPLQAPQAASSTAPMPAAGAMPVGTPTALPLGTVPLNAESTIASTSRTTTTTVLPQSTKYVERKTIVETPVHRVYVHKVAHYKHHKTDKVHVARATKHGAMFALKLPGRLAL